MPFKPKTNKEADANQPPVVDPQGQPEKPTVNPDKVIEVRTIAEPTPPSRFQAETETEAVKLFKKSYKLPSGDEIAYVAQDGNVFFAANESSARAHAKQKGIKLFTVKP